MAGQPSPSCSITAFLDNRNRTNVRILTRPTTTLEQTVPRRNVKARGEVYETCERTLARLASPDPGRPRWLQRSCFQPRRAVVRDRRHRLRQFEIA
jgi:hypothetical protein